MRLMRFVTNGKKKIENKNYLRLSLGNTLNDIRSMRKITPEVLSQIETDYDTEAKMKVIYEYRKCMAALLAVYMLPEDYNEAAALLEPFMLPEYYNVAATISFVRPYSDN